MKWLILGIGCVLNRIPETIGNKICRFLGWVVYHTLGNRRRILLQNLSIVFPGKSDQWYRHIAKINCGRWVETAWLFFAASGWSETQIKRHITLSQNLVRAIENRNNNPHPTIVLLPHLNLMETMLYMPCGSKEFPETVLFYRSFRHKALTKAMQALRERLGIHLVNRKEGVVPLEAVLDRNGAVCIFFDQSAGDAGCLTTFCERLASSTPLPDLLVHKFHADTLMVYPKRTGFLHAHLCIEELVPSEAPLSCLLNANRWLEHKLHTEPEFYENWLWLHRRWKTQCKPEYRFQINQKRNCLPETLRYFKWDQLPRRIPVWVRLPNWLGDCVMTYPILTALRKARPDFYLHAVVKPSLAPFIQRYFPFDAIHCLPQKEGFEYWKCFLHIRSTYPDVWINFTNSMRSDIEAFCSGAFQRFGLQKNHSRWLLTHTYPGCPTPGEHQTRLWYRFMHHFGLTVPLANEPYYPAKKLGAINRFACFYGSANTHEKRWPIAHWQSLIERLLKHYPNAQCVLLGMENERAMGQSIMQAVGSLGRVQDLTGSTTFETLEQTLLSCDFVIGNDSGGAHISNFLGVPTFVLFGPTDPQWGGPFFNGATYCVQSTNLTMQDLSPTTVGDACIAWIEKNNK